MKTLNLDTLNTDDFFDSMDREELNSFESLYIDYLKRTTNDDNLMTDKKYTSKELKDLHDMCNRNLKKISLIRKMKHF